MRTRWIWIALGLCASPAWCDADLDENGASEALGIPIGGDILEAANGLADDPHYPPVMETHTTATNGAQMENNSLVSTNTGINNVGSNGFSNITGIGTLIQNSGNQVVIQNSTIINLSLY